MDINEQINKLRQVEVWLASLSVGSVPSKSVIKRQAKLVNMTVVSVTAALLDLKAKIEEKQNGQIVPLRKCQ